ncbi:hypothetical protein [Consotaella salsifontis]|uniref:Uncharacterized protein n=1 Tax=Consotaella salsifontis TaxID=1365950 RepID=A0A1T4T5W2_9HYPH|nr:hypothetical protein [Consotaella salsifontis]SKA35894.1 hypothetical protein SAMN05428963_1203 [Consotaella salsifontis]
MLVRLAFLVAIIALFAASFSAMVDSKQGPLLRNVAGNQTLGCGSERGHGCINGSTSGLF